MNDSMESNTPIVLIGMMGAGKTTLGRALTEKLGRRFFDSDEEIVREHKLSIAEIFQTRGEKYFRELEFKKIAEILKQGDIVLSVGGGAVTGAETAALIFKNFVLWIDAPLEILAKRVGNGDERPLLKGQDVQAALAQKLAERQQIYVRADLHIINNGPIEDVVKNCLRQIKSSLLKIPS